MTKAPKYTVRITNDDEGIIAWIDVNDTPSIKQPHAPGYQEGWKTEAEAKAWADEHAAELTAMYEAAAAAEARKKELEDAQLAAYQAQIDTANHLKAIVDALPK